MVEAPALPAMDFATDVLETLRAIEWAGTVRKVAGWVGYVDEPACPFCSALKSSGQHTEDCRVMLTMKRIEGLQ